MIDFAVQNAWLIAVLPFVSACIITFITRKHPILSSRISRVFILIALVFSCLIGYASAVDPVSVIQNSSGSLKWFTSGNFDFEVSWKVDALTAIMLIVVTLISSLVQLYSREYMEEYVKKGYSFSRYYAELSLFSFSMLLLILTDNFLLLYAGWELVGVSSFLLIGFFYEKKSAGVAAKKAFLANRVGDFGFLMGILIIFINTGTLNFDVAASRIASGALTGELLTIAAILTFFGAIGKSGQFPLHVWLPDAMEGPTPVSALIHAATMVAAGVYMVAKIMTIFAQATFPVLWGFNALDFIAVIGGITAIMAAFIAITQTDIKKVLAYSTVSQLGFMILTLGMYSSVDGQVTPLGYTAAFFHLFTHAFFKAMMFLGSGSVIHACHTQDIREMGGLRKSMPITAITFLIGTAAISGFPLTAGFWSKDAMLDAMFLSNTFFFLVGAFAAILTAFYMFRLYFLTFEGQYKGHGHPHEPGWRMTFPLIFLSVPSLLIGFLGTPWKDIFGGFVKYSPAAVHATEHAAEHGHHGPNFIVMGASLLIFIIGFGLAFAIYGKGNQEKSTEIANKMRGVYNASLNKLYIDEAYQWFIDKIIMALAKVSAVFDKFGIDMIVNGVSWLTMGASHVGKRAHTGKVQQYIIGVVIAVLLLIFAFTNLDFVSSKFNQFVQYWWIALIAVIIAGIASAAAYVKKRVFS
ncbi:MAG: NADH-quinone oxidoreductase subunit L [Flavobacterium sp.]|nr:MAG: NADH-quinone oxidoreductase subunit L [Flavobacterium sp.]